MNAAPFAASTAVTASNLWKLSRLGQVLDRMNDADIEVLVLKGAALLGWLYQLDERAMSDVDLLIRPADRDRFIRALGPQGRNVEPSAKRGVLAGYESGQFSMDFMGLPLDVHVHLLESPWLRNLVPLDEDGIRQRALPAVIAGRPALRMSEEDQLLHLAAHATFHHADWVSDHPHRVNDAIRLLQYGSVDWDRLLALARAQKLRTASYLLFSTPEVSGLVPEGVLGSLTPGRLGRARIKLASRLARQGDKSLGPVLLTDRSLGILRAAGMVLTPSADWLRKSYSHVPSRPARVLAHYLRVTRYVARRVTAGLGRTRSTRPARPRRRSAVAKILLAAKIWGLFFLVQIGLRRYSLAQRVEKLRPTSADAERIPPRLLGDIVARVLHVGRFRARCLDGALVHYRLLAEQGHRGQLVIGLHPQASSKDAHAWVEVEGVDVGPPPGRGVHVPLARYP